jgi:hypothetical protein
MIPLYNHFSSFSSPSQVDWSQSSAAQGAEAVEKWGIFLDRTLLCSLNLSLFLNAMAGKTF